MVPEVFLCDGGRSLLHIFTFDWSKWVLKQQFVSAWDLISDLLLLPQLKPDELIKIEEEKHVLEKSLALPQLYLSCGSFVIAVSSSE